MPIFIHASEIHLDSPLQGLLHYEGAPPVEEIREAASVMSTIMSDKDA